MNLSIVLVIAGLIFNLAALAWIISIVFYQYSDDAWDEDKYGPKINRNSVLGLGCLGFGLLLQVTGLILR